MNDLVVGVQQIILYDNNRFYLELSLGGTEGDYTISKDTILFSYDERPSQGWPEKLIMTPDHFLSVDTGRDSNNKIRIRREK